MPESHFYKQLKSQTHSFVMFVYDMTEHFPKSELYGTVSQLRRAAVSIMLNFLEGYARFKPKVKLNFFETAYGSAQECKYLLFLARERGWIVPQQYNNGFQIIEEINRMLWSIVSGLQETVGDN